MQNTVTMSQRRQSALEFARSSSLKIPVVLDGMDDRIYNAFHVYQAALVVLDRSHRIAYHSGLAAYALDPAAVEHTLDRLIPSRESKNQPTGQGPVGRT